MNKKIFEYDIDDDDEPSRFPLSHHKNSEHERGVYLSNAWKNHI